MAGRADVQMKVVVGHSRSRDEAITATTRYGQVFIRRVNFRFHVFFAASTQGGAILWCVAGKFKARSASHARGPIVFWHFDLDSKAAVSSTTEVVHGVDSSPKRQQYADKNAHDNGRRKRIE
jgi:hypothetical protein